jgi:hypothetical protein
MQAREQNRVLWPSVQNRGKLFVGGGNYYFVWLLVSSSSGDQ